MVSTDLRIAQDKPVTPGFLFAVLLWDDFQVRITENALQQSMQDAENNAALDCLREQQLTIAIPRRFAQFIRDVWQLQPRLERRQAKNLGRMLSHPKFRAAYDFLLLRAELDLVEPEIAEYWTEIQKTHPVTPRAEEAYDPEDEGEDSDRSNNRRRNNRGRRSNSGNRGTGGNRSQSGNGNSHGNTQRNSQSSTQGNSQGNRDADGNTAGRNNADAQPKRKRRRRRPRRRSSGQSDQGSSGDTGGNSTGDNSNQAGNSDSGV
jgi:hypothetical protein